MHVTVLARNKNMDGLVGGALLVGRVGPLKFDPDGGIWAFMYAQYDVFIVCQ